MKYGDRRICWLLTLIVLIFITQAGCSTSFLDKRTERPPCYWDSDKEWVQTELFFGLARPDGSAISTDQWQAFVDQYVTPRFPEGLTIVDVHGQYRMQSGKIANEESKIIVLLHESNKERWLAIEDIRSIYKKLFAQESVLRASTRSCISF